MADLSKEISEQRRSFFDGPAKQKFVDEIKQQVAEQISEEFKKYNLESLTKSVVDAVALINAKCDAFGRDQGDTTVQSAGSTTRPTKILQMCKTTDELIQLNESAKVQSFVDSVVLEQGEQYGRNTELKFGRSVALNIIGKFVARSVFVDCCWTGRGTNLKTKVAFGNLTHFMSMFYEVVKVSDPLFTPEMTTLFLKTFCQLRCSEQKRRFQKSNPPNERAQKIHASDQLLQMRFLSMLHNT